MNLHLRQLFLGSLFIVFGALAFSGCTPVENTRGNLISETRFEQIHPLETTRYELRQIWGPPSAVSPFSDGDRWYYIGQRTEVMGIFNKETVERKVIRVDFDKGGIVQNIEYLDVTNVADIKPVSRKTPTAGKEFTVLQQLVGNLGRFNAEGAANGANANR